MASKNIVLKGATWNGVESIDLPVSGGGTARFVETSDSDAVASDVAQGKTCYVNGSKVTGTASGGGGSWSWMGENPTLVHAYDKVKVFLEDTAYATWTPSTSTTQIVAASALPTLSGISPYSYDYIVEYRFHSHFEYDGTETGTAQPTDVFCINYGDTYSLWSNLTAITSGTSNTTATQWIGPKSSLFYKNTSGSDAYYTTGYGVYMSSNQQPYVSSSGISVYTPYISARCNATYFSTDNANAVDQSKSYYEYIIKVWQVDLRTANTSKELYDLRDMWLNGI